MNEHGESPHMNMRGARNVGFVALLYIHLACRKRKKLTHTKNTPSCYDGVNKRSRGEETKDLEEKKTKEGGKRGPLRCAGQHARHSLSRFYLLIYLLWPFWCRLGFAKEYFFDDFPHIFHRAGN